MCKLIINGIPETKWDCPLWQLKCTNTLCAAEFYIEKEKRYGFDFNKCPYCELQEK